ncbi:hypothetical protein BKA70DRAFT_1295100 [Coprinopsis sp. MPI-PUGE-AT-0042]|nr:hypothetical protein BKA70DRAFT_1295100 [Coprinopsis sp. MPI-PUGE-AT-0042]
MDGRMAASSSQAIGVVPRTTGPSQSVHDVQVNGNFTVAGRDVHHHTHYHAAVTVTPSVLDAVLNFRGIHIANLSRATRGTGMWIRRWEIFWLWLNPEWFLMILWGFGMPGAGKTILTSIVVDVLEEYAKASATPICICYIYFRYSDHGKVTIQGCLETLVKQTIERHSHCVSLFDAVYDRHIREKTQPSEEELFALLRQFVGTMTITVYALDALDEAPPELQLELLEKLASLDVKLFVTSRPLKTLEAHFPGAHLFPIVAHEEDITLHIDKEISRSADLRAILQQADPSFQNVIVASVQQKCGGMFLHASLQLAALCECTNLDEVKETLTTFPIDIEDLYRKTWQRILAQAPRKALLAKNILTWVVHATRSLTAWELRQALATCPDTQKYSRDRLIEESVLIGVCHGLVTVEEKTRLVRLVHYTAKDTLARLIAEAFAQPHALLSAVCMARLTDCGFLRTTYTTPGDVCHFLKTLILDSFLCYAYNSWSTHTRKSLADPVIERQLAKFVGSCHSFPFGRSTVEFDLLGPLHLVACFNIPIAFAGSHNLRDPHQHTAFWRENAFTLACRQGSDNAVKELLCLPDISAKVYGRRALMYASSFGREGAIRLLLAHPDIKINALDESRWSALVRASHRNRKGAVILLLSYPDIEVNMMTVQGTALHMATMNGYEDMVTILLAHPSVDPNIVNPWGMTPLSLASSYGHTGIAKRLLSHPQIQVNAQPRPGVTALCEAVEWGNEDTVRLLLSYPSIEVGTREVEVAKSQGHHSIISMLEEFLGHS